MGLREPGCLCSCLPACVQGLPCVLRGALATSRASSTPRPARPPAPLPLRSTGGPLLRSHSSRYWVGVLGRLRGKRRAGWPTPRAAAGWRATPPHPSLPPPRCSPARGLPMLVCVHARMCVYMCVCVCARARAPMTTENERETGRVCISVKNGGKSPLPLTSKSSMGFAIPLPFSPAIISNNFALGTPTLPRPL